MPILKKSVEKMYNISKELYDEGYGNEKNK